jgi:dTDP-4-dehydrorhamnose 3,5-epimerase
LETKALAWQGLWQITPLKHHDARGFFMESFRADLLSAQTGLALAFMQDNLVQSRRNVLRGMHYQRGSDVQTKLVSVVQGEILDVLIDLRPKSTHFQQVLTFHLSAEKGHQLLIPPGIAHGYRVLSDSALVSYKVDRPYAPQSEAGIRFDDPAFAIDWGVAQDELVLSEKDRSWPLWKAM